MKLLILISTLAHFCTARKYKFPDGFMFGVSSSSYQIEGAWNESGKGENIWDHLSHTQQNKIEDSSNGDIACDSYHKTSEDVKLLKNIGVNFYRFSLSWSRILPTGHVNHINQDGVRYYNELINKLLAAGIKPYITIYHWDLPQPLQELGGWPNPLLADHYTDFANLTFSLFGDRVKDWITFNEPYQMCMWGYSTGLFAPSYTQDGIGGYLCGHTLLRAHAKTYRLYEAIYKKIQRGRVGITVHGAWSEPASDSEADQQASETILQSQFGWIAHPIYSKDGDYPEIMKTRIAALSAEEGFPNSRLPAFTHEEIKDLHGAADFLGFNHYTTAMCEHLDLQGVERPSHRADEGANCTQPDDWESSAAPFFKVVPWGFRKFLNWIKNQYGNPDVVVTENGYSDATGNVQDCRRINYYNRYLDALLDAIRIDGCNVTSYSAWGFLDDFEWSSGYTQKFGLHYVDFQDANRPRRPKMSAYNYRNIIRTRKIDWHYKPKGFRSCCW